MRAVLDANVLVSSLISPRGAPAKIMKGWEEGAFELIVSERLIQELERVFSYPRLAELVEDQDSAGLVDLLRTDGVIVADPAKTPHRSRDPDDDYLIALAAHERVPLVSGDQHLLELSDRLPVLTPREFLNLLDGASA